MTVFRACDVWDQFDEEGREIIPDGYGITDLHSRAEDGLTYCEIELRRRYREVPTREATIVCGYCGASKKSRSLQTLIGWFYGRDRNSTHTCGSQHQKTTVPPMLPRNLPPDILDAIVERAEHNVRQAQGVRNLMAA